MNKEEDKAGGPATSTAPDQRGLAQTGSSARLVGAISVGGMAYRKDVPAPPWSRKGTSRHEGTTINRSVDIRPQVW